VRGSSAVTDAFFTELSTYVEVFALYKCQILVAGDFNIHVERAGMLTQLDCVIFSKALIVSNKCR